MVLFGIFLHLNGLTQVFFAFGPPVAFASERIMLFLSGAASLILAVLSFRHFGEGYAVRLLAILDRCRVDLARSRGQRVGNQSAYSAGTR